MRNTVICTILLCIMVLSFATINAIETKTTRQNELEANLSAVMERSMEIMTVDPTYTISREDDEHLIADFIQNFLVRMNSKSEFQIEVLGVDAEKGMLSVRVIETYPSLLGDSRVSATKTVILEQLDGIKEEYFKVTFYGTYAEDEYQDPLKQVHVLSDHSLGDIKPVDPIKEGYTFLGWALSGYGELDGIYTDFEEFQATKDLNFVAAWEKDSDDVYTVIFYANNQVHDMKKVPAGAMIGNHKEKPVKNGYTFKGWTSAQDEILTDTEVSSKVVERHIKYKAVFE